MGRLVYTIRPAAPGDLKAVYEIEQAGSRLWKPEQFTHELDIPFSLFIVAAHGISIIAFAVAWDVRDELQILNIGVLPEYRRMGIGVALLNDIITRADSAKKVYLELREKNDAANHFYNTCGFVQIGLRKNYYPDDNAILMEKVINH